MEKEYFESHVLKCKECGSVPNMTVVTPMDSLFMSATGDSKFRVICQCDNKTRLHSSPEEALEVWNRKRKKKC